MQKAGPRLYKASEDDDHGQADGQSRRAGQTGGM